MPNTPETRPNDTDGKGSRHPWEAWLEATRGHGHAMPSMPDDISRRTLLVVLLSYTTLAALLYPVYTYWVQRELMARDLRAMQQQVQTTIDSEVSSAASEARSRAQLHEAGAREARLRAVRVTGIMDGLSPVVVVELGNLSHEEAARTICAQAEAHLKRSLSGTTLGIQRARGNRPSLDAGIVVCE